MHKALQLLLMFLLTLFLLAVWLDWRVAVGLNVVDWLLGLILYVRCLKAQSFLVGYIPRLAAAPVRLRKAA